MLSFSFLIGLFIPVSYRITLYLTYLLYILFVFFAIYFHFELRNLKFHIVSYSIKKIFKYSKFILMLSCIFIISCASNKIRGCDGNAQTYELRVMRTESFLEKAFILRCLEIYFLGFPFIFPLCRFKVPFSSYLYQLNNLLIYSFGIV